MAGARPHQMIERRGGDVADWALLRRPPKSALRPLSRAAKQRRHQVFEAQGADAALTRGAELGLARATLQSWTAEWRRAELRSQKKDRRRDQSLAASLFGR
jgi:hypothetical protein